MRALRRAAGLPNSREAAKELLGVLVAVGAIPHIFFGPFTLVITVIFTELVLLGIFALYLTRAVR